MTSLSVQFSRRHSFLPVMAAIMISAFCVGCSRDDEPSHEEIINAEFEAILELHDQDCSGVVSFEKVEELDYRVTCSSGEIYRVHVSHEGHINVAPHTR